MTPAHATDARERLLSAGTELIRREGYAATSVDRICEAAGLTKGAFFHHFPTKESLVEACLERWDCQAGAMDAGAPYHALTNPVESALGHMDFFIGLFEYPSMLKSCLAGTTVQETAGSHPALRRAAHACFAHATERLATLLDNAAQHRGLTLDTTSLASLWMAAVQGALILSKASQDDSQIPATLGHVRSYIHMLLSAESRKA